MSCLHEIPSFTRGKKQLAMKEVEFSQSLSKVRIDAETVIGLLKNKYTILESMLPVTIKNASVVDEVVNVWAALTNMCPSVVDNS